MKTAVVKYIHGGLGTKNYGMIVTRFLIENESDLQNLRDAKIIGVLHMAGIRSYLAKGEKVIVNDNGGYCNMKGTWEFVEPTPKPSVEEFNKNLDAVNKQIEDDEFDDMYPNQD